LLAQEREHFVEALVWRFLGSGDGAGVHGMTTGLTIGDQCRQCARATGSLDRHVHLFVTAGIARPLPFAGS
jgi:hypothetical protein